MTTFTANVEDKQSEKIIRAIFDALNINYQERKSDDEIMRTMNKKEKELYETLKSSLTDVKKWEKGELEIKDARTLFNELSS